MIQIGVIGSAGPEEYTSKRQPNKKVFDLAYELGVLIAQKNAILITGGKTGVMESASRGAKDAGGITVGIVKGDQRNTANNYVDVEIATNTVGEGEEDILISSCDGIIVVGGGAGSLQELACAYRKAKPIVAINTVSGVSKDFSGRFLDSRKVVKVKGAKYPKQAVNLLFKIIK